MEASQLLAVFAARVLEEAEARKLTINRLADFAGVSRSFLSAVLRKEKIPTLRTVARVARALEVEPWQLLRPSRRHR
jgi:transcriptional regulator with XRE-family HTH domain